MDKVPRGFWLENLVCPLSNERERQIAEELKAAMLQAVDSFFQNYLKPSSETELPPHRLQLAAAVLLIEMSRADLEIDENERRAVTEAIERALGLSPEQTAEIVRLAEKQIEHSIPLYFLTRLIDKEFSSDQKKLLIEQLWSVAFSDAKILAHEEYLVRKISELLHVPRVDFLDAKIRARDAFR